MSAIIYANLELLIEKIYRHANNPKIPSRTKIGEHIHCRYSISTMQAFHIIENKHTSYRGKDCMKKFCTSFREHANLETKEMLPLA